jgi:hypothetical protein
MVLIKYMVQNRITFIFRMKEANYVDKPFIIIMRFNLHYHICSIFFFRKVKLPK